MKPAPIILATLIVVCGAGITSAATVIQDLDGDGLYEDLNGNGRADFADVVTLFGLLPVLSGHPTIANLFDFNGNERLDFGDVVILFTSL
jgi:PKD repeat protein